MTIFVMAAVFGQTPERLLTVLVALICSTYQADIQGSPLQSWLENI
jgi:hypothetical protein